MGDGVGDWTEEMTAVDVGETPGLKDVEDGDCVMWLEG